MLSGDTVLIRYTFHGKGHCQRAEVIIDKHDKCHSPGNQQRLPGTGCKSGNNPAEAHQCTRLLKQPDHSAKSDKYYEHELI